MLERDRIDGGRGDGPVLPFELRLKTIHNNYLVCQRWDATAEAYVGSAINVAKPPNLRRSELVGQTLTDPVTGEELVYTYPTGNQQRTVSKGSTNQDQVVTPRYFEDVSNITIVPCQPVAVPADGGGTVVCKYVEINQGRSWATL